MGSPTEGNPVGEVVIVQPQAPVLKAGTDPYVGRITHKVVVHPEPECIEHCVCCLLFGL